MFYNALRLVVLVGLVFLIWRFGSLTAFHIWAGSFAEDEKRVFHSNCALKFGLFTALLFGTSLAIVVSFFWKKIGQSP
jgi:hypothetical protein